MNDEMNVNGEQQSAQGQQSQGAGYQPQQSYQQPQGNGYQPQQSYQQPQGYGYQPQPNYQQPQGYGYPQQQNMYQTANPQAQGGYQSGANYNYGQYEKDPKESTGFGIASLVLGIIAVVLFCTGCNILLAVLAIIFGIIQLVRSNYKGMAIGGIITGGLSIVFFIIYWIIVGGAAISYDDIYDKYYYNYDSYNDYGDLYEEILEQYQDF